MLTIFKRLATYALLIIIDCNTVVQIIYEDINLSSECIFQAGKKNVDIKQIIVRWSKTPPNARVKNIHLIQPCLA